MGHDLSLVFENISNAIDILPLKGKHKLKNACLVDKDEARNIYMFGKHILNLRNLMAENENIFQLVFKEGALENDETYFMLLLGGATLNLAEYENNLDIDEFFFKEYSEFISEILEIQNISLSELHNLALETSDFLKAIICVFKARNEDTHFLEKFYEINSVNVLGTMCLLGPF